MCLNVTLVFVSESYIMCCLLQHILDTQNFFILAGSNKKHTTFRRAEDNLPMDLSQDVPQPDVVSVCMWNVKQMRASYGLLY